MRVLFCSHQIETLRVRTVPLIKYVAMSDRLSRTSADLREEFVAYLDGELEADRVREVEKTLAKNPVARREVEMLAQTWELLDQLPQASASETFSQHTMSTIAGEVVQTSWADSPAVAQAINYTQKLVFVAVVLVCGVLGFVVARIAVPQPWAPIVEEVELFQRLKVYEDIQSKDYLRRLKDDPVWQKHQEQINQ